MVLPWLQKCQEQSNHEAGEVFWNKKNRGGVQVLTTTDLFEFLQNSITRNFDRFKFLFIPIQ